MRHVREKNAFHAAGGLRAAILFFELDVLAAQSLVGRDFLAPRLPFFKRALNRRTQPQNAVLHKIVGGALLHVLDRPDPRQKSR